MFDGFASEEWAFAGGLDYTPVEQLTLGIDGEWSTISTDFNGVEQGYDGDTVSIEANSDTFIAAFTGAWRFQHRLICKG